MAEISSHGIMGDEAVLCLSEHTVALSSPTAVGLGLMVVDVHRPVPGHRDLAELGPVPATTSTSKLKHRGK